jgi:hypothetical protein
LFSLQEFVNDVLRYYNLNPTQIHLNELTINMSPTCVSMTRKAAKLFAPIWSDHFYPYLKLLRILNVEPIVKVFRHYYTMISNINPLVG